MYIIVSSSLKLVVFNGRLFLAAFRYFSIILFCAALVFGEDVNLHQGLGALFQVHNLPLLHLHYLPNECVSAGCSKDLCMGLHLTDSSSCTFTRSPVIPPVTRSLNEESGDHTTDLELILSRTAASLFVLSSGESLCYLVVVHDRSLNCCIAMLYSGDTGLDMVQEALCFPDIRFRASYH